MMATAARLMPTHTTRLFFIVISPMKRSINSSFTRDQRKGWRGSTARAVTVCTRWDGGESSGTCSSVRKSRRSSSNRSRAAGSEASAFSSVRACAALASPSSTACISSWSVVSVMSGGPQVLEEVAQPLARLEEARLHGLHLDLEDAPDLLVAAFGKVPQCDHRPVGALHSHQRLLDPFGDFRPVRLPLRVRAVQPRRLLAVAERFLAPVAPEEIQRLVHRDAVDPAEELVARVVVV